MILPQLGLAEFRVSPLITCHLIKALNLPGKIGSLGYILADFGRGTGPRGLEMVAACPGVDYQVLATILDPFRVIFDDLGPDRLSET